MKLTKVARKVVLMDICMLSELFFPFMSGGAERRYYEIAKRLAKNNNVTVYSLKFHGSPAAETVKGIKIVRVGLAHPADRRSVPHLSTFWPAFARAFGGDYDVIDANWGVSTFSGFFKIFSKRPVVATFHDVYWNKWGEYFPFPISSLGKASESIFSRLPFDRIIANSPATAKKLRLLGFRPPIDTIVSGVDTEFIRSVKAKKTFSSAVYVGRLVKYKNVDSLVRSFALLQREFPKAELRIVGTGPEEANLKRLASELGVNARFYGFVSEKEKIRIIKSSTVLVNPSSIEGLGLILIESMACRTPVIARNLSTYFFCNGRNSILYDSTAGLDKALLQIFKDRRTAARISAAGLKTSEKFSWDNVAKSVENVYRGLL